MARLSRYLLRLFSMEALALFAIAAFLLFLIQCLRLFDLVSARGQGLLTLVGQALLGMPSLGVVFLYVCVGIGLGRALRNMQDSSELQVIHAGAMIRSLMRAIAGYAVAGAVLVLGLIHVVEPLSIRTTTNWTASIAADLVSRSMIPHRFTEITSGVSMVIGSRNAEGEITEFFADHNRGGLRRTYFAESALIVQDEQGYVLRLQDGAMQQMSADGRLSEISFASFDLSLDQLTGDVASSSGGGLNEKTSFEILAGPLGESEVRALVRRSAEGLRVLAICALVAALAAFPTGARRRVQLPVELVVLGAAFLERGIGSYIPLPRPFDLVAGPLLIGIVGMVILLVRLRVFAPVRRRAVA